MEHYWQEVHRRAFAETCFDLGLASRKQIMIKAAAGAAIILALALWGSADASRDEIVVRLALIAVVALLFPIVYAYNFIRLPPELARESERRSAEIKTALETLQESQKSGEISQSLIAPGPHIAAWANERTAHKIETAHGEFRYMFEHRLERVPDITVHDPIPGTQVIPMDITALGFRLIIKQFYWYMEPRFFADASFQPHQPDELERSLGGEWFGDRFVLGEPVVLFEKSRTGVFSEPVSIRLAPCPPGAIAEVLFECGPTSERSAIGLRCAQGNLSGRMVAEQFAGEDRTMVLQNYMPIGPKNSKIDYSTKDVSLTAKLLGWIDPSRSEFLWPR